MDATLVKTIHNGDAALLGKCSSGAHIGVGNEGWVVE